MLPMLVERELDGYVGCGMLAAVSPQVRCGACGHELLVPFSCTRRPRRSQLSNSRSELVEIVEIVVVVVVVRDGHQRVVDVVGGGHAEGVLDATRCCAALSVASRV